MIEFLLAAVFVISLATALIALACIRAGIEYDKWMEDFNKEGIKTALEPVLHGPDIVGYTLVGERRSKPR